MAANGRLRRDGDRWQLYSGRPDKPSAEVVLPVEVARELFTRGITPDQARAHARLSGDFPLALRALDTVSILA